MTGLTREDLGFYEWWHAHRTPGMNQDQIMAAFMAGWDAATKFIAEAFEPAPAADDEEAGQS